MRRLAKHIESRLIEYEDVSLTLFLVVLCLLSFGLVPLLEWFGTTSRWISVAFTLLFVVGAFIGGLQGIWRYVAFALALVSTAARWLGEGFDSSFLRALNFIAPIVFMTFVCFQLMREVFRPGEVNGHRIRGAIAVYLLIGLIFALLYGFLEHFLPGSFDGLGSEGFGKDLRRAIYFSFVTLTTLGFGDITPVRQPAQTAVVVEAIIGQLFLAILIGRLVSLSVPSGREPDS